MPKSISINQVLNNSTGGFAQVLERAKLFRKLTFRLKNLVDAPLNEHIHVANIRDNTLIVGTDSAVWHTRIRYLAPAILQQMKQIKGLESLERVEFRVQPSSTIHSQKTTSN